MKKKILLVMLTVSMIASLLACGKQEEVVEEDMAVVETIETMEEIKIEEVTIEEPMVEEALEETVDEVTELTEEEKAKYQIADFVIGADATNFKESDYLCVRTNIETNLNNFVDYEVMQELEARGYDISNFVVTWIPGVNQDGIVKVNGEDLEFMKFHDSEEAFVPLYPFFVKTAGWDDSKLVYASNSDFNDIQYYSVEEIGETTPAWLKILEGYLEMKADSDYEIINFNFVNKDFESKVNAKIAEFCTGEEGYETMDMNEWYNAIIYSMFELKTVDLKGAIDWSSVCS